MRAEKIRWKDEREVSYEIGTQPRSEERRVG